MRNLFIPICSALFFAVSGFFPANVASAPFVPPVPGGLVQCMTDLEICTIEFEVCNDDLTTCSADLGSCTSGLGACTSDLGTCSSGLTTCTSDLREASENLGTCQESLLTCQEGTVVFPATGQTNCWTQAGVPTDCTGEGGEDGYFQAGGALAYTWNDDGTIVDENTKLMWERKDMSGGIHDVRTQYRWVQTFRDHIKDLNNRCKRDESVDCSENGDADCVSAFGEGEVCGFAGYRDWRMPNAKELQSIVDYSRTYTTFNQSCVEGCSVMGADGCSCRGTRFWTSTTYQLMPDRAFFVNMATGSVSHGGEDPIYSIVNIFKSSELAARAVRGGL